MDFLTNAAGGDMLLFTLLVMGPVVALYGGLQLAGDLRKTSRKKIASRLRGRTRGGGGNPTAGLESLRKQDFKASGLLGETLGKLKFTEKLQRVLMQANVAVSAPALLVNLTLVATIGMAVLMIVGLHFLIGLAFAAACYVLPILYFLQRRKRRINRFATQLTDVFEMLSQALRAGHSLASGMQLISQELPDPAGTEFGRVFHEQNLGLKIEDALLNMANRMDMLDVRLFVTAVLIQRQTGGDLAEVLDKIASVIRERIKLHGTVQALTAEGRLSGYVLLALPFLVFGAMLRINYAYAETLWTHPVGQMMALFAIVQMGMGWMMIKKIINIKV